MEIEDNERNAMHSVELTSVPIAIQAAFLAILFYNLNDLIIKQIKKVANEFEIDLNRNYTFRRNIWIVHFCIVNIFENIFKLKKRPVINHH